MSASYPHRDSLTLESTPRTPVEPTGSDLVSVVIPALNEQGFIIRCLEAIRAQDYRNLQIIVVDGGSTDQTVELVEKQMAEDLRIELLHNTRPGIPTSLNLALPHVRGRWLVRVDAHSSIDPPYVGRLVRRLSENRWGGVGGRKVGVGLTPAGHAIAAALESRFGVGNSVYHHGIVTQEVEHIPFGAYPVELVRHLDGWDERLVVNEDYEFDHRIRLAGMTLLFDPDIVIKWHCRQSIGDLFRQYLRYGTGKAAVMVMHPGSNKARHLMPPAFVVYVAAAGMLALRRPGRALTMLAPYVAALGVATVQTARELDSAGARVRVAPAFVSMHVGWGLGFWRGLPQALRIRNRVGRLGR